MRALKMGSKTGRKYRNRPQKSKRVVNRHKQQALWISPCEKHHIGIHSLFIGNEQQKPGRIIGNRR